MKRASELHTSKYTVAWNSGYMAVKTAACHLAESKASRFTFTVSDLVKEEDRESFKRWGLESFTFKYFTRGPHFYLHVLDGDNWIPFADFDWIVPESLEQEFEYAWDYDSVEDFLYPERYDEEMEDPYDESKYFVQDTDYLCGISA